MKHTRLHRFTALALVLAMSLSLVLLASGCGSVSAEPADPEQNTVEPEETEPSTEPEEPEETQPPTETEPPTEPSTEPAPKPQKPATPPKKNPPSGSRPYYIKVNCETNTVTVYEKDENGAYTVPYMAMVCSSGTAGHPSPIGTYRLTGNRWTWLRMVGHVWGMYVTQIKGNYLFHSVPYLEKNNHGSLQPGEFDKLGSDASHGCIRLQVKDAKWIYDNMKNIQGVELFNSPDADPLGKPTAPTIGDSAYPGWDPSDPASDNPWNSVPVPVEPTDPEAGETEAVEPESAGSDSEPLPEETVGDATDPSETEAETEAPETETVPSETEAQPEAEAGTQAETEAAETEAVDSEETKAA